LSIRASIVWDGCHDLPTPLPTLVVQQQQSTK
jgi:hypothetical protein